MKITKWELFFVFEDGERESMWEITRKGKNLLPHEMDMLNKHAIEKCQPNYDCILVATYDNGKQVEV